MIKLQHGLRAVTHEELTHRIQVLDLGASAEELDREAEPRWIDAAELARRVAPFLSLN